MSEHAATMPVPQEPVAGLGDGIVGMLSAYFDPATAAKKIAMRWFWIYPLIVICIAVTVQGIMMQPYAPGITAHALQERGISGDALQNQMAISLKVQRVIVYIVPVFVALMMALSAWLISVAGSIVDVRTKFRNLYGLVTAVSMIYVLQIIATLIVLRTKSPDDVTTRQDLQPPFGLDIFLHDLPKALQGVVGFFSIFQIWMIVMLVLIYSALTRTSKGKAFFATSPAWIVPLIFAVLGSLFS